MPKWSKSYMRGHSRLRYHRGSASEYDCAACGEPAESWSSLTGDFENIDDYEPLCWSCHISKDRRRAHDEREDHDYDEYQYGVEQRTRCWTCHRRGQKERLTNVS